MKDSKMMSPYFVRAALGLLLSSAAVAQARPTAQVRSASATSGQQEDDLPVVQQPPQTPLDTNQAGRLSKSAVGRAGQRQTREQVAPNVGPTDRIASRIQNRVQNRIRNRIDGNYNPHLNTTDPFAVAEDQARVGGRPR